MSVQRRSNGTRSPDKEKHVAPSSVIENGFNGNAGDSYDIRQTSQERKPVPVSSPLELVIHWACWTLWLVYFYHRFLDGSSSAANTSSRWLALSLLFAECCCFVIPFLIGCELSFAILLRQRNRVRPSLMLVGDRAPTVNVFISVCGEDMDVFMDTVTGAYFQDYPASSFRVFILDDGKDDNVKEAIAKFSETHKASGNQPVAYIRRPTSGYLKSGNVRYGLEESKRLSSSPFEYYAILDADMIAAPDWLRRVVPHLVTNPKAAIVACPQHFYNLAPGDTFSQDSRLWADIFYTLWDSISAAQCLGTGFIGRRSAIDDLGGWPLIDLSDDLNCSNILTARGWEVNFVNEQIQVGLAPDSFSTFFKQRIRWSTGNLAVFKDPLSLISVGLRGKRTLSRTAMAAIFFGWVYGPGATICGAVLLPVTVLSVALTHSDAPNEAQASRLQYLFLVTYLVHKLNVFMTFRTVGVNRLWRHTASRFWGAPYRFWSLKRYLLPSLGLDFTSVGTLRSKDNELSARHRKPLPGRLLSPYMLMHVVYGAYTSICFATFLGYAAWHLYHGTRPSTLFRYPACALWLWDCLTKGMAIVMYMTFPPDLPEREQLLRRTETGAPVFVVEFEQAKNGFTWMDWVEVLLVVVFTCF